MASPNPSTIKSAVTESGLVYTGPCVFHGFLVGTDGLNDPEVTILNSTDDSGDEVIPTCSFDASALGLNGATGMRVRCSKGLYAKITAVGGGTYIGNVEVVILYVPGIY